MLENEKKALESDVSLKTEVVVQTSEEARELRVKLGEPKTKTTSQSASPDPLTCSF